MHEKGFTIPFHALQERVSSKKVERQQRAMELWTLRREDTGASSKNSPGIDPCRPSDVLHKCGGQYLRPHYIVLTFGIRWQTATTKSAWYHILDPRLTSGPPRGDGAEEAGEQQEQGHLSPPAARDRVEILLTLLFLCSFFEYLGKKFPLRS